MKRVSIYLLCLLGLTVTGLPLHAEQALPDLAGFLTVDAAAPAEGDLAFLWASCTPTQCRAICECGGGCVPVCTNPATCSCTCKSTHVPPLPCQV